MSLKYIHNNNLYFKKHIRGKIAKAKKAADKIREEAEKQINVEKEKAISEIKKEVVQISISVAEKLINKNLSESDNKSLIEESLKKINKYEA